MDNMTAKATAGAEAPRHSYDTISGEYEHCIVGKYSIIFFFEYTSDSVLLNSSILRSLLFNNTF